MDLAQLVAGVQRLRAFWLEDIVSLLRNAGINGASITGDNLAGPIPGTVIPYGAAGYPVDVAATEADGAANLAARSDHRHAHGSGYLADAHHAQAHHAAHENGGGDELGVAGLSGQLGDKQDADKLQGRAVSAGAPSDGSQLTWVNANNQWEPGAAGGAGGGDVSTDAIWDAAGDLAVGTGADTAGRLAKGAAYSLLAMPSDASTPAWLAAMVDWTPTVTQSGAVSVSITYAKYLRLGNLALVMMWLTCTNAGTGNNDIVVGGIPAAIAPANTGTPCVGVATVRDAGTGFYNGNVMPASASTVKFVTPQTSGGAYIGKTPNFALANTDEISFVAMWPI